MELWAQDKNFQAVIKHRGKEQPWEAVNFQSLKGVPADERDHLAKIVNLELKETERD